MTEQASRQRRKTLTDRMVAALPRRAKRYVLSDPEQRGMYIRACRAALTSTPPSLVIPTAGKSGRRLATPMC